jgi:hypothetical protein
VLFFLLRLISPYLKGCVQSLRLEGFHLLHVLVRRPVWSSMRSEMDISQVGFLTFERSVGWNSALLDTVSMSMPQEQ